MNFKNYLIVFCIAFSTDLAAQIVTDRPDQTESSSTIPKGALQVESGFLIGYEGDEAFSRKSIISPNNLFRYGLTKGFELRLVNQYESSSIGPASFSGISDLQLGFKAQLFKRDDSSTEVAFLSHLILPTGSAEFTIDEYGTINKLSISHQFSETLSLGYNLGYDYYGTGSGNLTYTFAFGVGINEKWAMYVEPYGELNNMEEFVLNYDAGITYLLNPNFQFDFSFGNGITDRMNYIAIGCSWLVERN